MKQNEIKMIAMDIDGTLVNQERKITQKTQDALLSAQAQGITLVLASGRPTTGLTDFAKQLKMDKNDGYIVSYNGSQIVRCADMEILYHQPLESEQIKRIIHHLRQFDVYPMVDDGKTLYVDDENTYKLDYEVQGSCYQLEIVEDLEAFIDFKSSKVLVSGQPEVLQAAFKAMKAPFEDELSIAFSAPFYVEFTAKGVDKGRTLNHLSNHLNIKAEEVVAFGDGGNDVTMIQYAGLGVAMENAVDYLKEQAQFITHSNQEDGIAYALHQWLTL